MKKALGTVSVVLGFVGMSALILFFVETGTALPHRSLTADISASDPTLDGTTTDISADDAVVPPVDTSTIEDTSTDIALASDTDTNTTTIITDVTTSTDTTTIEEAITTADTTTVAIPTTTDVDVLAPTTTPDEIPTATPPDEDDSSSLPVATATITVTPTAPAPSLPPPPAFTQTFVTSPVLAYDESSFRGDQNWQSTWGSFGVTYNNFMDIAAGPGSTGGSVYLADSISWANYTMNTTLDWVAGRTIGLMANYTDASNYVACQYSKVGTSTVSMQLLQYIKSNSIPLTPTTSIPWNGDGSDLNLSIDMNGVYGTCSFGPQTISNATVGPGFSQMNAPGNGGVGFIVGDPTPNTSELIVKHVNIIGN